MVHLYINIPIHNAHDESFILLSSLMGHTSKLIVVDETLSFVVIFTPKLYSYFFYCFDHMGYILSDIYLLSSLNPKW